MTDDSKRTDRSERNFKPTVSDDADIRDPRNPKYPIFDQDDEEKLWNEFFISFFVPTLLTIGVLAFVFRFAIGDLLTALHPAFAEPIDWGADPYGSIGGRARVLLFHAITCTVMLIYFWAYLKYFRDWFRARGWV